MSKMGNSETHINSQCFNFFYTSSSSSEILKQDDSKSTLITEEMTTSDDELMHNYFGEWPVEQDITGPALVSMPTPPERGYNPEIPL